MSTLGYFNTSNNRLEDAPRSFYKSVIKKYPYGNFPLMGLMSLVDHPMINAHRHFWRAKSMRIPTPELTGNVPAAVGNQPIQLWLVDTVDQLVPKDILWNPKTGEQVFVSQILSEHQIQVTRGFMAQGAVMPAYTAGSRFVRISAAFEENSLRPIPSTDNAQTYDQQYMNLTQIIRTAFGVSGTVAAEYGEGAVNMAGTAGLPIPRNEDEARAQHAERIELAAMFGQLANTTFAGQPMRMADGFMSQIQKYAPQNVHLAGQTTTYSQLEDMLEPMVQIKTDATSQNDRLYLTDSQGARFINKMGRTYGNLQMTMKETTFGQRFNDFSTATGNFKVLIHPLMDLIPEMRGTAIVLDPSTLSMPTLRKTRLKYFNKQLNKDGMNDFVDNGQDSSGGDFLTELTFQMLVPEANGMISGLCEVACEPCAVPVAADMFRIDIDKPCTSGPLVAGSVVQVRVYGKPGAVVTLTKPDGTTVDVTLSAEGFGVHSEALPDPAKTYSWAASLIVPGVTNPVWSGWSVTACTTECHISLDTEVPLTPQGPAC